MAKMTKKAQVLELLDAGWSATEAAKEVGTSRQYVYSLRYKAAAPKKQKAKPKKKQPATTNGTVDEKEWLQVKRVDIPKPKVGYEITVRAVGLDLEELSELLASVRDYGTAEVTKVVDLK